MWDEAHQLWQSSAHFHADRQGGVDLARQAPEGGSYSGQDGMGLFWSLLPAHDPKPEATHVYATTYGAQTPTPPAAWTLNGKPLPWLPVPLSQVIARDGLLDDRPAFESSLANQPAAAAAAIQVEKIAGPLLLISGTDDQAWPSDRYADLIEVRRKTANVPYADQSLKYEGAGHLISQPYLPTNLNQLPGVAMGGNPRAYALADADSWPRVLRFLGGNES